MFTTHKLIGSVLLLLTPAGLATALLAVLPWDIKSLKKNLIGHKNGRPYLFTLMLTAVPFLIIFFFSLTKEIKINWTGPIWLVTLPFMAHSLQRTIHTPQKGSTVDTFFATGWSKTVLSLILVYGMGLHYLSIGLPGIPFPTNNILLGWEKLAQKVEKKVHSLEITNGKRPVIVGMDKYRIASGVSFYRSRDGVNPGDKNLPAITGRHLFGLNSLMFSYWHPSTLFSHQDLLVLSQSQISLHPLYFKDRAMNVGSIKEFTVTKNGKEITKFYYRVLRGYIPSQGKNVAGSM